MTADQRRKNRREREILIQNIQRRDAALDNPLPVEADEFQEARQVRPVIEKKMTNLECMKALGVGFSTVSGVRKMMGIGSNVRKVFGTEIEAFLRQYPDFCPSDAASAEAMALFQQRHPKFKLPYAVEKALES